LYYHNTNHVTDKIYLFLLKKIPFQLQRNRSLLLIIRLPSRQLTNFQWVGLTVEPMLGLFMDFSPTK